MIRKLLASAVALCLAAPAITEDYIVVANPAVEQVDCDRGQGTAFRISDTAFVTAAHVAIMPSCKVGGKPYRVIYSDGARDYAVLAVDTPGKSVRINCDGFKAGEQYFAEGFAGGLPFQRMLPVTGTGYRTAIDRGHPAIAVVAGNRFIPGMSGGPVLDRRGEVVGIVNAYSTDVMVSFSRELRDTYFCSKAVAGRA